MGVKIAKEPKKVTLDTYMASAKPIGGIYRMTYSTAQVLTDDFAKNAAGGVPQGAFLLAAAGRQTPEGFALGETDQAVLLLKVVDTAALPNEMELVQARMQIVRDAISTGTSFDEAADVLTRAEMQQSAFDCVVLGTFYVPQGSQSVTFRTGQGTSHSAARYQVFVPSSEALSLIASYSENADADRDRVEIGRVRYTSAEYYAERAAMNAAAVTVDASDLVAKKTAVFGMTRTGKSNTIKTLATTVFKHAHTRQATDPAAPGIGQVIFDPQGEYANDNKQDNDALVSLGDYRFVRIYRLGADGSNPQVLPLEMNFFDPENLPIVTEFVKGAIAAGPQGSSAYAKSFNAIEWEEPDRGSDRRAWANWSRARLAFYALLAGCGLSGRHDPFPATDGARTDRAGKSRGIEFVWNKETYDEFMAANPNSGVIAPKKGSTYIAPTPDDATEVLSFMKDIEADAPHGWRGKSGDLTATDAIMTAMYVYVSVRSYIQDLKVFHSHVSTSRVEDEVWDDMRHGRIAIVDLSVGDDKASQVLSETIVNHLLNQANDRFRSNLDPVPMQIIVEEAHNLFDRHDERGTRDPWVRLSKEAAKYHMGLIYATQEVTSVSQKILSNTSNWFIAHLNSQDEIRALSKYYDFKGWDESLLHSDDRGYVRMKTYSNKFTVPVQIAKFDRAMIDAARAASGQVSLDERIAAVSEDDDDDFFDTAEDAYAQPEDDVLDDEEQTPAPPAFDEPDAEPVEPAPYQRRPRRTKVL